MSQLLAIADQDRSAPPASRLLREFSHRINNEFASAIAIVSIASARTESDAAKTALNDVRDRLHSYAQVHRALAMPELNPIQLDADRCWQMALVVSELITNSARHAFHRQGGSIRVEISQAGAFVQCIVSDNGCAEGANQPGSGSKILRGLAESLGGTIEQRFGQEGARATLMFPMDPAGFQPRRLDSGAS
jgi:two-component sensor histidine kinase